MDDCLTAIRGSAQKEAADGANPISVFSTLCRDRNVALILGSHDFAQVSPVYVANCSTVIVKQSRGSDVRAIKEYMSLTNRQAEKITELTPEECVVLSDRFPGVLYGKVPRII